jgi:hypothetical protein
MITNISMDIRQIEILFNISNWARRSCFMKKGDPKSHDSVPISRKKHKKFIDISAEVGSGAFFALSRSRARSQNTNAKAGRKNSPKKAKATSAKEKSECAFFLPFHRGSPVPELKAARQGESIRVLIKMYSTACYI